MSDRLPSHTRVVIVGGGVIGVSIAYHLTKLGWSDVVLLERDQLTSGTTWHAAGLITSAGMSTETLLWSVKYSRELHQRLEAETGLATGFMPIGVNRRRGLTGTRRSMDTSLMLSKLTILNENCLFETGQFSTPVRPKCWSTFSAC